MKIRSDDSRKVDDLDLEVEVVKDLTPAAATSDQVKGGMTGHKAVACFCGSW